MSASFFLVILCKGQQVEVDNGFEKGLAENGYKVGVWEYYGINNNLELKIDYNQGTVIFLEQDTASYYVRLDSTWSYQKLDSHPRYIGSTIELYQIISSSLMYPLNARLKNLEKTVFLEFDIDTNGQAVNGNVLNDDEGYFTQEILGAFDLVPNLWLTAKYKGENVPSKFILPFYFKLTGGKKSKEFDQNMLNTLDGKKINEVVITAPRAR